MSDHTHHAADGHDDHGHGHHVHVTPFWTMLAVFVLLLALTYATVETAQIYEIPIGNTTIEFGATAHIIVALLIAGVKAALVLGFFMHLLYDKAVNTIVLASTLFAVVLFIGLTLMDLSTRDMIEPEEAIILEEGGSYQPVKKANERKKAGHGNAEEHADAPQEGEGHGGDPTDDSYSDEEAHQDA